MTEWDMKTNVVDIENVENLLEYVYEGIDDINDVPNSQEYQKIKKNYANNATLL